MKKMIVAALLCATATGAFAQEEDTNSLSGKQMEQQPVEEGTTAKPTAKPDDSSLSGEAMEDHPGTTGGSTDMPTAEPKTGDLPAAADEDDIGEK